MRTKMLWFAMFGIFAAASGTALAEDAGCFWRGKAPFCNGDCPNGYDIEKVSQQGPEGSKKCATGNKVYCCPGDRAVIFGKAPFCNGKCPAGWTRIGDSDEGENGAECTTGKAAVCVP